MKEYIVSIPIILTALLASWWLEDRLVPIVHVAHVEQVLVSTTSLLFGFVILFWGFLTLSVFFRDEGANKTSSISNSNEIIGLAGLIGIPLTLIVATALKVAL